MKYTINIKKKGTFRYLINKGKYFNSKNLIVYFIENKKQTNTVGVCVSKKNGKSVHRNKMKRWVREVYKDEEKLLKKGLTIVFMYKKNIKIEDVDYYKIKEDIINAFKKLNLYEV